ncbi:acyl-CoA-binding protein 6 [Prunus dulcis]|uniref:Acyl-CoA-binding protein 6 n=1 Tax=Prunus dulcis TaxID=3755 RepID=A0A4Y1RF90_PRUDU|nr:acyl-CoA-binding protein 6 [Prunus dulcis]
MESARIIEEFDEYAEKAKTLPESTTNENKLILYGLYKQATVGAVNTSRPGIFNMRDRAKWDAWKAVEGNTSEQIDFYRFMEIQGGAMGDYVTKVKQLLEEAGAST